MANLRSEQELRAILSNRRYDRIQRFIKRSLTKQIPRHIAKRLQPKCPGFTIEVLQSCVQDIVQNTYQTPSPAELVIGEQVTEPAHGEMLVDEGVTKLVDNEMAILERATGVVDGNEIIEDSKMCVVDNEVSPKEPAANATGTMSLLDSTAVSRPEPKEVPTQLIPLRPRPNPRIV